MKTILAVLALFVLVLHAAAQAPSIASLSNDDTGKRVLAYFDAFNSDEPEKLLAFFTENLSPDALKQRPAEPRAAFHKKVRSDLGKVRLESIVSIGSEEIKVIGRSANGGAVDYTFGIAPDRKLTMVAVQPMDAPAQGPTVTVPAPSSAAELPQAVTALLDSLAKDDKFSGVAFVSKDGSSVVAKAWGMADASRNAPNHVDTRFNLGSINKLFTRIAIGQLVKAGKLTFEDKLSKVLPAYPNKAVADRITIGQIVAMRSGLGDFINDKYWTSDKSKLRSIKDYLPLFVDAPLEFEPGTRDRYSNAGYLVLGLVIEKLSGQSYYEYVSKNIFQPAGMKDTDSFALENLPSDTAIGYTTKGAAKGRVPNAKDQPMRGSSAGGGYSTAEDLVRLAAALKAGKLVVPGDDGSVSGEFRGIGIAGGSEGVNALFATNPTSGYTVVVLSNYDPPSAEGPGRIILDWVKAFAK